MADQKTVTTKKDGELPEGFEVASDAQSSPPVWHPKRGEMLTGHVIHTSELKGGRGTKATLVVVRTKAGHSLAIGHEPSATLIKRAHDFDSKVAVCIVYRGKEKIGKVKTERYEVAFPTGFSAKLANHEAEMEKRAQKQASK